MVNTGLFLMQDFYTPEEADILTLTSAGADVDTDFI